MVAVVFVGPVGGVDDVGIRGGGRHGYVFDFLVGSSYLGFPHFDLRALVAFYTGGTQNLCP
eukprot:SAG31_NODE_27881_length_418_cov_3.645768_1_plen_61_part_00